MLAHLFAMLEITSTRVCVCVCVCVYVFTLNQEAEKLN